MRAPVATSLDGWLRVLADGMAASSATAGGAARDWLAREANPGRARIDPSRRVRRLIADLAAECVRVNLVGFDDPALSSLCEAVLMGDLEFEEASARVLELPNQRTTR